MCICTGVGSSMWVSMRAGWYLVTSSVTTLHAEAESHLGYNLEVLSTLPSVPAEDVLVRPDCELR